MRLPVTDLDGSMNERYVHMFQGVSTGAESAGCGSSSLRAFWALDAPAPRWMADGVRGGQGSGSGTGAGCAAEGVGSVARRGLLHGRCIRSPRSAAATPFWFQGRRGRPCWPCTPKPVGLRPETGPTSRAVPARCSVVPIVPTAGLRRTPARQWPKSSPLVYDWQPNGCFATVLRHRPALLRH